MYLLFGLNITAAGAAGSEGGDGVNELSVEGVEVFVFWGVKIFKGAEGANVSNSCW